MRSTLSVSMRAAWLCVALALWAPGCGGGEGGGDDDGDSAGLIDAGGGGAPDAGGGGPDAATGDIADRLAAIPGLTVMELESDIEGYRFFYLEYQQPVDHDDAGGAQFTQRMTLLHRDEAAPMVLFSGGYYVSTQARRTEIARLAQANQLSVEHRFFPPSQPVPADWSKLTIEQAAHDFHRIRVAFGGIYGGAWVGTGGSKGGMTALFHRRFHPDDLDGTVPYVAPISTAGGDLRYGAFIDQVGDDPACRQALIDVQRRALGARRTEMMALLAAAAMEEGMSFDRLGVEVAFEHTIVEMPFFFWQYLDGALCSEVPGAAATAEQDYAFIDAVSGFASFSDDFVEAYEPYFYQAGTQFGWPGALETHIGDLLLHPGTDVPQSYAPVGVTASYDDGAAMGDVLDWVATEGERLLFIYGENDPWTAGQVPLGGATESFVYVVPGGNHGSRITQLPAPERDAALATLSDWMGVPVTLPMQKFGAPPELDPLDLGDGVQLLSWRGKNINDFVTAPW